MSMIIQQFHFLLLLCTSASALGNFSTDSSEFYIAFPKSVFNYEVLSIYISNSQSQAVVVFVRSLRSFNRILSIEPRSVHVMYPPSSFEIQGSSDYDKGIWIYPLFSGQTVSVSVMKLALISSLSGEYLALPPLSYPNLEEYAYYITSYQWNNRVLTNYSSIVLLVGTQANTSVILTPTQRLQIPRHFWNPSYNWSTVEPGESYSFKVNEMETVHLENFYDLTGTKIVSDKPITVIGGHECVDVPIGAGFCDALVEQFPPTVTWGRFFLVMSLNSRQTGEQYRIIAMKEVTVIKVKCVNGTSSEFGHVTLLLNRTGQVREFELGRDRYCSMTANKPILLVQYSQGYSIDRVGDPFMAVIPPVEQYKKGFVVAKAPQSFHNHISITVSPEYYGNGRSIFIDNTLVNNWIPIYCGVSSICGYGARQSVEVGIHKIQHTLPQAKFFVMSYGFEYHDGYGSSAGMEISQIADICMHGDVRLKSMNESDVKEGHVELCLDGVWSRICDTSSWTNTDAIVVCRQILGAENIMGAMGFSEESRSNGSWHYAIGDVHCVGSESKLLECSWSKDNVANEIAVCPYAMAKCYSRMNITVDLTPSTFLPYFVRSSVTLDCMATISPAISMDLSLVISWRKNNESLLYNSLNGTYSIQPQVQLMENSGPTESQFKSSLTLSALKIDDAVLYDCLATVLLSPSGIPLAPPTITSFRLDVNETASVIFQLKLIGVGHCSNWLLQYDSPTEKGKEVTGHVVEKILSACSNCSVTHRHITDATFKCFSTTSNSITFRARLYDTSNTLLPTMVKVLEDWVTEGPSITIKGVLVAMDPRCMLIIPSFAAPECVSSEWLPITTQDSATHTSEVTASTIKYSSEPRSTPLKSEAPPPDHTTTTNAAISGENSKLCSSNQEDSPVIGTSLSYIVIAIALVVAVLIVAIATIIVVLICLRYSYKKAFKRNVISTASFLTSYDDPVEGRIHLETTESLRSKEPSLKLEIPPFDSTDDPDSKDRSLKQEILHMDNLDHLKSKNPSMKEDLSLEMYTDSLESKTPSLKLEIPHEDSTYHCKRKKLLHLHDPGMEVPEKQNEKY